MIFWHTFLESIKLPQKKAMFTLNRTGMDIAVVYMFILLFIVSIPSLIDRINSLHTLSVDVELFFLFIYFFMFYYLPLTIIVFILLSIIAAIAVGLAKLMKRKLRFSILWKMAAYTTTVPFIIYTMFALIFSIDDVFLWFSLLYTLIALIKMISVYPKRRIKIDQKK